MQARNLIAEALCAGNAAQADSLRTGNARIDDQIRNLFNPQSPRQNRIPTLLIEAPHPGVPGGEVARGLLLLEATASDGEGHPILRSGIWTLGEEAQGWDDQQRADALLMMIPEALRQAKRWRDPPADLVIISLQAPPNENGKASMLTGIVRAGLSQLGFVPSQDQPSRWFIRLRTFQRGPPSVAGDAVLDPRLAQPQLKAAVSWASRTACQADHSDGWAEPHATHLPDGVTELWSP